MSIAEAAEAAEPRKLNDIPGWFFWMDRLMFERLLQAQADSPPGHLVELGCYLGKSAVTIGAHRREGERFVVVDLFERTDLLDSDDDRNREESARSYSTLTQQAFERNYRALRGDLPEVVVGMSSTVVDHLPAASVRFMHVDASHLYEAVRGDAESARKLLRPGGLVVFDDFRSEHTPGTAAAVWEAVLSSGLVPVAITRNKMYAVLSDPEPYQAVVEALVADDDRIAAERHLIAGHWLIRIGESQVWRQRNRDKSARAEARRVAEAARQAADDERRGREAEARRAEARRRRRSADRAAARAAAAPTTLAGRIRQKVTRDLAPPILVRWVRRRKGIRGHVPPPL